MKNSLGHQNKAALIFNIVISTCVVTAVAGGLLLSTEARAQDGDRGPAAQQKGTAQAAKGAPARTAAAPAATPAPQGAPGSNPSQGDDKVDISDLERKYWSTKDTDFNVVQNRLYSKAGRFGLSANYGLLVNDPWNTGQVMSGDLSFYPSERFGIEGSYEYINTQNNTATNRLIQKGAYPDSNKLRDYFGIAAVWVPFYAKMSVLSSQIIYFDMQVSLGAGMQSYAQQMDNGANIKQSPAVELAITQHFFITKHFAIRLDLKNRWYREEVVWYNSTSVLPGMSRTISNDISNATVLTGGLTFLF